MAQGKKTSSKTIADIVADKIDNPDLTLRELAEGRDVSHVTVKAILEEKAPDLLTSSNYTQDLFDSNVSIIKEGRSKIELAMKRLNPETIRDTKEYQEIVDKAFKQNEFIGMKGK